MGGVFGKINEEMPAHRVVYRGEGFEVWKYPSSVAAVVRAEALEATTPPNGEKFSSKAFWALAGYIGVLSKPANVKPGTGAPEAVAMTAPVVMGGGGTNTDEGEKIAMTAPVVMTPAPANDGEKIAMTAPVVMTPATEGEGEKIAMTAPVVMEPKSSGMSMAFLLPSKYKTVEDAPVPTNPAVSIELMPVRYEAVLEFNGNLNFDKPQRIEAKAAELLESMKKDGIEPSGPYTISGYNAPFTIPWLKRNEVHYPVDANDKFTEPTSDES